MASGFRAGDVITLNLVVNSNDYLELYDQTTSTTLTAQLTAPGSLTYTVPADTSNTLRIWYSAGPSTEITWSCISEPEPQSEPTPESNKDSSTLRSLQKSATKQSSQIASISIASMINGAIGKAAGTASAVQPSQPSSGGLPPGASGLGMGERRRQSEPTGPGRLIPWADARFSESVGGSDVDWDHTALAAGASFIVSSGLIVGAFGGYEKSSFDQESLDSKIEGDGRTAGAYLSYLLAPRLRFDGAVAHSWLDYDASSGTADAEFDAGRWMFLTRLSGDRAYGRWTFTPSTEVFWLRETQDAYVDSLGTAQAKTSFTNGRANGGLQAAYAIPLSAATTLSPFAGLYADYYFGMEDDGTAVTEVGIGDGWAARATGGLAFTSTHGWAVELGAEAGNLGGEGSEFWTGRLGGSMNF